MSSRAPSSPLTAEAQADLQAERHRVSHLLQRLRESPDWRAYQELLNRRRVAEGEIRINDLLKSGVGHDVALWASEIRYWRGFADGLYLAMTIPDHAKEEEPYAGPGR